MHGQQAYCYILPKTKKRQILDIKIDLLAIFRYPPQQIAVYPNQAMPTYAMPQPQGKLLFFNYLFFFNDFHIRSPVDLNPPSYDEVIRGGEAYQKQAPYNPKFTE